MTATNETDDFVVDAADAYMSEASNAETARSGSSTTTNVPADDEKVESHDNDATIYVGSDEVDCARPNF